MGGTRKNPSIIHEIFQGEVQVESQTIVVKEADEDDPQTAAFDEARGKFQ